jgi:hypothetical protein
MNTHSNPADDEYLALEKKLGAQENEITAGVAEAGEALDAAKDKRKREAETAGRQLKQKLDAHSPKHD